MNEPRSVSLFEPEIKETVDPFHKTGLERYYMMLSSPSIKELVMKAILNAPPYFWTLDASTSGKYHSGEKLIDHVLACCEIMSKNVFRQMDSVWKSVDKDRALAGMILHDLWRCGYPGEENQSNGKLHSHKDHAAIGARVLLKIWADEKDKRDDVGWISEAVKYHYGPWGPNPDKFLSFRLTDIRTQVHIVDAHQAWNANYIAAKKAGG